MSDTLTLDDLPQPAEETTVHPDELDVDGDNPNSQTDNMFGLLCENMRKRGWIGNAIVADADGLIADGEHRWRAAQEIGLSEVPVKFYDIDDAERRLWRQELNKISGTHDTKRDALEYDYLLNEGMGDEVHALTKAAEEDLDELLAEIKLSGERSAPYEYDPEHNVYFEDCVEGMRERLEDDSVDCVITDPPYGVDWDTNSRDKKQEFAKVRNDESVDNALGLWKEAVAELRRVLAPGGHLYCFGDWRTVGEFRDVLADAGFTIQNVAVWDKEQIGLGGTVPVNYRPQYELIIFATFDSPRHLTDRGGDVFRHPRADSSNLSHPTQKPVGLVTQLLEHSTEAEHTILDPFMGSGTTAVAAVQTDREYIGFELDEENYRPVIERRIGEAKRAKQASVNTNADDGEGESTDAVDGGETEARADD